MVLVNGGFLHCTDIKNSCKFFSESDKKKIGQSNLKKSGERSRAILALLFICPKGHIIAICIRKLSAIDF